MNLTFILLPSMHCNHQRKKCSRKSHVKYLFLLIENIYHIDRLFAFRQKSLLIQLMKVS